MLLGAIVGPGCEPRSGPARFLDQTRPASAIARKAMALRRSAPAIVASIIALANSVGAEAVAEGVEAVPQLQALRRLRCERAQGFFWAPSLPLDELVAWIETNDRRTPRARSRR